MSGPIKITDDKDIAGARWLSIVGIGEDGVEGLSEAAKGLIANAELVVGGTRHLALAADLIRGERLTWPSPIEEAFPLILAHRGQSVAVIATGDPFHYGIGKQLASLVPAREIMCLPQPSAFSLAAARMGWALQDVACITLHGRALEGIIPHLQPGRRILALSWDGSTPARLKSLMVARGFGGSQITIFESMGGAKERSIAATISDLDDGCVAALNTLGIEVRATAESRVVPLASGLDDDFFEHDGQLTKREIRAVVLSSLAPRHGELLWDVGLGAGSIAIEWLLADPSLRAIGIEERHERAVRAKRNALALGVPGLDVMVGQAPAALEGLASPDAIFIGGGLSETGVFEAAWAALKPGGRLVANAVTIESEARLATLSLQHGGELTRIAVSRAGAVGQLTGWRAAMPVTIWRVRKP
ncbi:MAG: precorrin-6y C5,15-methyltransferase (decarboxylating) subunit CbiE [Hyphomicrobium sp.]